MSNKYAKESQSYSSFASREVRHCSRGAFACTADRVAQPRPVAFEERYAGQPRLWREECGSRAELEATVRALTTAEPQPS